MIGLDEIKMMIENKIPDAHARVSDMTGTGDHFDIEVTSSTFAGKTLLEQHRMVFAALEAEMDRRMHAVKLKTSTPKK